MSMGQLPQPCPCGYLQLGKHAHGAGSWKLCVCCACTARKSLMSLQTLIQKRKKKNIPPPLALVIPTVRSQNNTANQTTSQHVQNLRHIIEFNQFL